MRRRVGGSHPSVLGADTVSNAVHAAGRGQVGGVLAGTEDRREQQQGDSYTGGGAGPCRGCQSIGKGPLPLFAENAAIVAPMATKEDFEAAVASVNGLSHTPDNKSLLELYGFYKQATDGDVQGKRPGMLDVKGRAKYDAWAKAKGLSPEDARAKYIAKAKSLGA